MAYVVHIEVLMFGALWDVSEQRITFFLVYGIINKYNRLRRKWK